ncbi:SNF2 domain-containing protein [Muricomes intestini]|uniref:SNF2 domain-containing protein n=1 Tax=Muricomes intestini TaxID=1796634 RepID=A0A4R3K723_9FIRM|nr:DEAD/DEAH box helicase [Muricomes intestini]TCS78513.1 SNF2 domain-containing protein [Muricomes intestini]
MKYRPHDYQEYASEKIIELPETGLFLDMGLGKTVTTLTAIDELMFDRFEVSRVLVIAPKRVAEDTWTTETEKWDHLQHLKISRVLGTQKDRIEALQTEADIYVINRENVVWLVEQYRKDWPFDMVVVDELSSFKSNKAKRFKALKRVRPLIKRFVGLTGTPTPNGLLDLWPQMYLIDRGERLGKTISSYRDRYFYPGKSNGHVVYTYELKTGAGDAIQNRIADICISMKAGDYLKMPELTVNDIPVRLSGPEMATYKELEREKLMEVDGLQITALTAATVYNKLLQMANGSVYSDMGDPVEIHQRKLEALEEILDTANGQPVLIFYNYRHDYDQLMRKFKKYDPQTLKGQSDIRSWNDGRIQLLLAQPASMGHGLNLQAGGHIIVWYGLNWSLELYQQANARLYRQGQKKGVIIHRLITLGTVDEDVIQRLENKDATQESLMQSLKARIKRIKEEAR